VSTEFVNLAGYHGKVPKHGDFVSRGLPNTFIGTWDVWLQEAIHTSQQQLGNNWLNYYLTSPLYRFVLSRGICGDMTWMGTMMPSVDKVGRYYPMTIGLNYPPGLNPFLALQNNKDWFEQVEQLTLSCLNDDFNLESFYQSICQLTPATSSNTSDNSEPFINQLKELAFPDSLRHPLSSTSQMSEILPFILDSLLKDHALAYSVWWTQGSDHVEPSLLICTGLPSFDGISAMFDGNWQQWGWEGKRHTIQL